MSGPDSYKTLLSNYNAQQYETFARNEDEHLILPAISPTPGIGASQRKDQFSKTTYPGSNAQQKVKFIKKNDEPYSFVWETQAQHLKSAVRWGIMKPQSITGTVISALGKYRITAHARITKGIISNSHATKIALLNFYQEKFEALQSFESMANKNNSIDTYHQNFTNYINTLKQFQLSIPDRFNGLLGFNEAMIAELNAGVNSDIVKAEQFLESINKDSLSSTNLAKGQQSILEFVKLQMHANLYEMQGINQDVTFSMDRRFAFTRGELNDVIEDARKEIDDHQPDLMNAVTAKHHGMFSSDPKQLVNYDFSRDHLSPQQQRDALIAISYIEGWDRLEQNADSTFSVSNDTGRESIDTIYATRWVNHRGILPYLKSIGFFVLNIFSGLFVSTRPWEEETWANPNFHLVSTELQKHTAPNEPVWKKPFKLFKLIAYAFVDLFKGVRDFAAKLMLNMPDEIVNDWESTQNIVSLSEVLISANKELSEIDVEEKDRLKTVFAECKYAQPVLSGEMATNQLACVEYTLSTGEQNDILTAIARGVNEFGAVFSHNLFAKNPLGGIAFTSAFAVAAGSIYFPVIAAKLFSKAYVDWFSHIAYTMGSTKAAATISAGSSQAQIIATAVDGLFHGPSGLAFDVLYKIGEDPITIATYFTIAFGLGYLSVNGAFGVKIPWLSDLLKEDLGTNPATGYPFIGAKLGIMLYEGLMPHHKIHDASPEFLELFSRFKDSLDSINTIDLPKQKAFLTHWLTHNADSLPKLSRQNLFNLSRQIERLFTKSEADSLKKLLYPESHPSIAFQIFSLPLSYIPRILRVITACILTVVALFKDKANPYEPIKRAGGHLYDKMLKDLSRLLVLAGYLVYIPYTAITTFAKAFAFTLTMLVGRIASMFEAKPGVTLHRALGKVHEFFRTIGEFLYPVKAVKSVAVAHPTHTILEIQESYKVLLEALGESKDEMSNSEEDVIERNVVEHNVVEPVVDARKVDAKAYEEWVAHSM